MYQLIDNKTNKVLTTKETLYEIRSEKNIFGIRTRIKKVK